MDLFNAFCHDKLRKSAKGFLNWQIRCWPKTLRGMPVSRTEIPLECPGMGFFSLVKYVCVPQTPSRQKNRLPPILDPVHGWTIAFEETWFFWTTMTYESYWSLTGAKNQLIKPSNKVKVSNEVENQMHMIVLTPFQLVDCEGKFGQKFITSEKVLKCSTELGVKSSD